MFYARTLFIADMVKMKVGHQCVDFTDHKGDYRVYLQQIMTHLVIYFHMPFIVFDT